MRRETRLLQRACLAPNPRPEAHAACAPRRRRLDSTPHPRHALPRHTLTLVDLRRSQLPPVLGGDVGVYIKRVEITAALGSGSAPRPLLPQPWARALPILMGSGPNPFEAT